ncbi:restriction endonuclease subunit S [Pseudoalteromonas shioyasakiensis]|uniref:restriction endonuclease subunit S n=1 Tax=Pseudoalteromonas shioyasakiensis TaxID=1190813 RepID=UPI0020962F0F|nr:restriction endonuclease subunit S [Pseudoalteromonas shioyasakiensis]MCO6354857.1 restriction endonuclease subunit S [Pseudoalteromonas shioyasakiensis]
MNNFTRITLGDYIETLTDYHANGSYKVLKENVELKDNPDYAIMIRTLNFERPDFKDDLIYLNEKEYNYLRKTKVYPNDILMNKIANPGSVYLMPDLKTPVSLAMNLFLIRFNSELNQQYMYYLMKSNEKYIKQFANGTTTLTITKDAVRGLEFNVPPKEEQDNIAAVLSTIEAKIEKNDKINSDLEKMAELIYKYWFVQFDFPDINGKPYKSSGGKMIYNEKLKREIPVFWEVKELETIATCIMGQSPKGDTYNTERVGTPLINGPADYKNGALFGRTYTTAPTRLCEKDDMVLCIRATIGNLVYSEESFCLGRGVAAVRPNNEIKSELIYFQILQEIERFKMQATGSIIKGITKDDLTKSKCLIPNEKLILQFHKLVKPMFDKQRKNREETLKLIELRDWLLPMLMNGQVSVKY